MIRTDAPTGPVITFPNVSAGAPRTVWVPAHSVHHAGVSLLAATLAALVVAAVAAVVFVLIARRRPAGHVSPVLAAGCVAVLGALTYAIAANWSYTTTSAATTHHDASRDMGMGGTYSDREGGVFATRAAAVAYAQQVQSAGATATRRGWKDGDGGNLACWSLCDNTQQVAYPVGDPRGVRESNRVDAGTQNRLVMSALHTSYGLTPVNASSSPTYTDSDSPSATELHAATQYVDAHGDLQQCVAQLGDVTQNAAREITRERITDVTCVGNSSSIAHFHPTR